MEGLSTSPYLLYKMIGFDALHVLDLGVTRLLVQWLVEVFPKICDGDTPLLGTDAASRRICNERLQHLGRRTARVAALGLHDPVDDGEESNVPAGQAGTAQYDWPAYHAVWKETPIDEAITVMFAEFAVLHAEMSGYTCSTAPMPLTLDVGKCIADRAERFVTMYLTPILGAQNSTKVHKLLCHVMEAIRMHGNINNGNAGINERLHKDDKPYYARTNKAIADFTRQLVVQAQGARIILRRNAEEDECLLAGLEELVGDEDTDS
eukprot:contig_3624_g780